jgi:hypothetical protein
MIGERVGHLLHAGREPADVSGHGLGEYSRGAGAGVTINMEGSNFIGFRDLDAFLDELVRRLRQRGV